MIAVPNRNRVIVEDHGANLRITMLVVAPPFFKLVLGAIVVIYLLSEISGIISLWNGEPFLGDFSLGEKISKGPDFTRRMLMWLALWTAICLFLTVALIWVFAGKEIIELNSMTLTHIWKIPVFSHSREYTVARITHLRLMLPLKDKEQEGVIVFDYGHHTHRLGAGLDEANAHYVIREMRKRVKSLAANVEAA